MRVDLFDYFLPADRIAQAARPRGTSRLLLLDRATGRVEHRSFSEFPDLLREGDVLVRNDVRVRRARLWGRDEQDRLVEIFLLEPSGEDLRRWTALARPGRRAKAGREIRFAEEVSARVETVHDDGRREVVFDRPIDETLLERIGNIPLPPYIRREAGAPDRPEDRSAYQTVFAREPRAVAAPTAGLHFTPEVLERIARRGVTIADLTLSIGAATFKPVRWRNADHRRRGARGHPAATVREVARARAEGRRVVARNDATRALEAAARLPGGFERTGISLSRRTSSSRPASSSAPDALLTNFTSPLDASCSSARSPEGEGPRRLPGGDPRGLPLLQLRRRMFIADL